MIYGPVPLTEADMKRWEALVKAGNELDEEIRKRAEGRASRVEGFGGLRKSRVEGRGTRDEEVRATRGKPAGEFWWNK